MLARVCMQDYGSFVPDALKASHDPHLHHLGQHLDLFPYVYLQYDVGLSWVASNTHALVETHSYLAYIVSLHHVEHTTYIMKETVREGRKDWNEMSRFCSLVLSTSVYTSHSDIHENVLACVLFV